MSTDEQRAVHEAIARGLAFHREPDLSGLTDHVVALALARVFTPTGPDPAWWSWLCGRVAELSTEETRLVAADPADFATSTKSPAAAYGRLEGVRAHWLVIVGPFRPPVVFDAAGESSN